MEAKGGGCVGWVCYCVCGIMELVSNSHKPTLGDRKYNTKATFPYSSLILFECDLTNTPTFED
jgi:hypothetical protein